MDICMNPLYHHGKVVCYKFNLVRGNTVLISQRIALSGFLVVRT